MKKICNILLLLLSVFYLFHVKTVHAWDLDVYSEYIILYNLDDDLILYEKNADTKISVASLTKIMTSIVAIENIDNLDEQITLTNNVFYGLAEANASVAGFKVGEKVTYRDLLMGALLPSGADATRALALNISGSEEAFVELMNAKVKELNLANTHFENTTGLESPNHYSTVRDISIILKYALNNETFKTMYTTREYTTTSGLSFSSTLKKISKNYNVDLSHILGSKTGYTDEAGLCMSSIANYNDVNYLLVTAGADYRGNIPRQLLDAINIYDYVSKIYSYKNLIDVDDYITTIDVKYSKTKKYDIKSNTTITKFLDNSFNNKKLTYNYKGIKEISYKNNVGEKLGTVDIIYDDKIMDTIDVFLNETIKFDLLSFLIQSKYIYLLIVGFITILLILITIIRIKLKKAK